MDWITFKTVVSGVQLTAVQRDGRPSSELASDAEIDHAISEAKRQLDQVGREAKAALKKPRRLFDKA